MELLPLLWTESLMRGLMSEPQFVNGKVVGQLENGVFFQRVQRRHILRVWNAKGIDFYLHKLLRGKCRLWRLEFEDHETLEIAYNRIELSGTLRTLKKVGRQWVVPLQYFDELRPATQRRMV